MNHRPRDVERRLQERVHARERLGHDADDRELVAVQAQRLADDVGSASELALPGGVAQHDDRVASRHVIVARRECSAERRHDPQRREEVAIDEDAERDARLLPALLRDAKNGVLRRRQTLERLRSPLNLVDFGIGEAADRVVLRHRRQMHHAAGLRHLQRAQQDRVDEAEDRRRRAHAESSRQHHRQRKPFAAADEPKRVADVFQDGDHHEREDDNRG
jgi:hypothetical protein